MIPQSHIEYYGDQTRWFIGQVASIDDPLHLGRIKVRIYGVHNSNRSLIPDNDLPWAQTVIPVTEGGSSGLGATVGIQVHAQVFGFFLDGKASQLPVVVGSLPKIENASTQYLQNTKPNLIGNATINNGKEVVTTNTPDSKFLSGSSNVEKAYNYFISREGGSFTPIQTAAMLGNFLQESGTLAGPDVNPFAVSAFAGEGSIGIAQWNPARAAGYRAVKLKKFAGERNLPWTSLYAQVQFVKYELNTVSYLGLSKLKAAKNVNDATEVFCFSYERPAKQYAHVEKRQDFAREVLDTFNS